MEDDISPTPNSDIEVTFRFNYDMPWMKVSMSIDKYADVLNGKPFDGELILKEILTESFYADEEETKMHCVIYDTFEKTWKIEYVS